MLQLIKAEFFVKTLQEPLQESIDILPTINSEGAVVNKVEIK